jgi:16S rRNA (adenine1518-N6/adenine1519-N6)-dimethyltransferase
LKFENLEIDWKLSPCLPSSPREVFMTGGLYDGRSPVGGKIGNWKLAGNIPYYLTAPLIRKFLEHKTPPSVMVLMVQKEMAQRICAKPPNMSILAVSVQIYANAEIIAYVPRNSFWPMPKVDSAIIKITPSPELIQELVQMQHGRVAFVQAFFGIVRAGFSNPRKQLGNNLPKELLKAAGIDATRRAETLSVEEWVELAKKC